MGNSAQDCAQGNLLDWNIGELGSQELSRGLWEALELEILISDQASLCFLIAKGLAHPGSSFYWDLLPLSAELQHESHARVAFLLAFPLPLCFSLAQLSSSRLSYQPAVLGLGSADLAYPVVFTAGLNTTHTHQVLPTGFPGLPLLPRSNTVI